MIRLRSAALLLGLTLLGACEKGGPQDILGTLPGARVRFFNFGINAPSVNFYANDAKMTAISSTTGLESTVGTAYGAAGANGLYSGIAPGSYTLAGRVSAATDNNLPIASVQTNIENGKAYSFYMSGFYDATTKKVDAFVVEDPVPDSVDFSVALVRFVNASPNSTPMVLYARNTTTSAESAVGGAVAYKSAGAFVSLSPAVYDISTRPPNSSTTLISRTGVSFSGGRVYTVSARGDMTVTSTTATTRPFLDNTANR